MQYNPEKTKRLLLDFAETAHDLRLRVPILTPILNGYFRGEHQNEPLFNVYADGGVVSRELVQEYFKNPTVGIVMPGTTFSFPTGEFTERLTVLSGELEAFISTQGKEMRTRPSNIRAAGAITAPPERVLSMQAMHNQPTFYLCNYYPIPKIETELKSRTVDLTAHMKP